MLSFPNPWNTSINPKTLQDSDGEKPKCSGFAAAEDALLHSDPILSIQWILKRRNERCQKEWEERERDIILFDNASASMIRKTVGEMKAGCRDSIGFPPLRWPAFLSNIDKLQGQKGKFFSAIQA